MSLSACTLFDAFHLRDGLKCCRSITRYGYCETVYALCLDNESLFSVKTSPNIQAISPMQVEGKFPELCRIRDGRPWRAYAATLKPFLIGYMLDCMGSDKVFMVDSDVLFFSSPVAIETEMESAAVLVTSRRQDPPPLQGNINGGFFACDKSEQSREFVSWWQKRVLEWCLWEHGPDGRFTEEGYLQVIEKIPWVFPGCRITAHPGINMAWWTVGRHLITKESGEFIIDRTWPLVNFHYQGKFRPKSQSSAVNELYDIYFKESVSL